MKTKTITERLKDYLVPVSDERKQFREALECNRREVERFREAAQRVIDSRLASLPAKS